MSSLSRRNLMASTLVAALAVCVPEVWPQTRNRSRSSLQENSKPAGTYLADFADEIRLSGAYTLECAQAMPEARYFFRPVPEMRTFGQQMVHIAESARGIFELFVEGKRAATNGLSEAGQEVVKSKADVMVELKDAFEYVEKAAPQLNDGVLEARVRFLANREISKRRVLRFLLDHTTHHRGQTVVYLRLSGVRPPLYRA